MIDESKLEGLCQEVDGKIRYYSSLLDSADWPSFNYYKVGVITASIDAYDYVLTKLRVLQEG